MANSGIRDQASVFQDFEKLWQKATAAERKQILQSIAERELNGTPQNPQPKPQRLSVRQAAAAMHIDRTRIKKWIDAGILRAWRWRRGLVVDLDELRKVSDREDRYIPPVAEKKKARITSKMEELDPVVRGW